MSTSLFHLSSNLIVCSSKRMQRAAGTGCPPPQHQGCTNTCWAAWHAPSCQAWDEHAGWLALATFCSPCLIFSPLGG
eukprot:707958-Pelagomonas_calceolata.AAC.1